MIIGNLYYNRYYSIDNNNQIHYIAYVPNYIMYYNLERSNEIKSNFNVKLAIIGCTYIKTNKMK